MEELSTIRVGNLGIPLPINSLELHHTQRQQDEIQGELIQWQWVDKAKNVPIIGCSDSCLALQSFSRSIASTLNYLNSRLDQLSLPSLVFNKKISVLTIRPQTHVELVG